MQPKSIPSKQPSSFFASGSRRVEDSEPPPFHALRERERALCDVRLAKRRQVDKQGRVEILLLPLVAPGVTALLLRTIDSLIIKHRKSRKVLIIPLILRQRERLFECDDGGEGDDGLLDLLFRGALPELN